MDWIVLALLGGGAWWLLASVYKSGKREGSRKGYGVGVRHRRSRR